MKRIYEPNVMDYLQSGMAKKIFVVPEYDGLIEFYVDSATCEQLAVEWTEKEDPKLWLLDDASDWNEWWQKYLQVGTLYKTSAKERSYVEKRKNECIQKGVATKELVYWTRLWEAVKFIRKDRRIAV